MAARMASNMLRRLKDLPATANVSSRRTPHRTVHSKQDEAVPRLWESNPALNPYKYTSGRFLHLEDEQLRARHIDFDFNALCRKAIAACPGACRVVNYEKKEGGFNRIFILRMDNDSKVIARIPFRLSGSPRLTTHSEVATIAYVRSFTSVPVPEILNWSDDPENGIGTPYIILRHVPGVSLQERWPTMDTVQKIRCVERLSKYTKELGALKFPVFGSLYFSNAPLDREEIVDIGYGFCIGPHCGTNYWHVAPNESRYYERRPPNRGPWKDIRAYSSGMLDTGYSRLPPGPAQDEFGASVDEHLRLLKLSESILDLLLQAKEVQEVSMPTLLHNDFHKRNIYVSDDNPQLITSIVDWQATSIEPMFYYAQETPDFVLGPPNIENYLRGFLDSSTDESPDLDPLREMARKKLQTEVDLCQKTYTTVLRAFLPKLWGAKEMDQTYFRLFRYCSSSWRDGAVALRQELLDLSQRWQELGLPGTCPYQPSAAEIAGHIKDWEDFETVQRLRSFMFKLVGSNSDGWVPNEQWEDAQQACHDGFEQWMETVREGADPKMTEDKARKLWPFPSMSYHLG